MQALVYSLNRQLQGAYIDAEPRVRDLILHGGDGSFLGREVPRARARRHGAAAARAAAEPRRAQCADFVHDARLALGETDDALARHGASDRAPATVRDRGRTWALSAQVQAYALALTITFLALLLAAGALAAERDENVLGRLARGLASPGRSSSRRSRSRRSSRSRSGSAIALAFGVVIEVGGVDGGEPWAAAAAPRRRARPRRARRSAGSAR